MRVETGAMNPPRITKAASCHWNPGERHGIFFLPSKSQKGTNSANTLISQFWFQGCEKNKFMSSKPGRF